MWQHFAVGIAFGMHFKSVNIFYKFTWNFIKMSVHSPTSLSNSCPWIHCMTILFNISVTVFVIMSDGSWILDKYSSCIKIVFTCARVCTWRLADISFRHQCCVERNSVCVCGVLMLVFGLQRPWEVTFFSDSDYLHAVQICCTDRFVVDAFLCNNVQTWGRSFVAFV